MGAEMKGNISTESWGIYRALLYVVNGSSHLNKQIEEIRTPLSGVLCIILIYVNDFLSNCPDGIVYSSAIDKFEIAGVKIHFYDN